MKNELNLAKRLSSDYRRHVCKRQIKKRSEIWKQGWEHTVQLWDCHTQKMKKVLDYRSAFVWSILCANVSWWPRSAQLNKKGRTLMQWQTTTQAEWRDKHPGGSRGQELIVGGKSLFNDLPRVKGVQASVSAPEPIWPCTPKKETRRKKSQKRRNEWKPLAEEEKEGKSWCSVVHFFQQSAKKEEKRWEQEHSFPDQRKKEEGERVCNTTNTTPLSLSLSARRRRERRARSMV